jgi:hypothetical protein
MFGIADINTPPFRGLYAGFGALSYSSDWTPPYLFAEANYGILCFDARGPLSVFGAIVPRIGPLWPPNIWWPIIQPLGVFPISGPAASAPIQLSTTDGTIQGIVNGVNRVFTVQVYLHRAWVFRNGVRLTANVDYGFGGIGLVFTPRAIPQTGDTIKISGWDNW